MVFLGPEVKMQAFTCSRERMWGQARGFANSVYSSSGHEFSGLSVPEVNMIDLGLFYFSFWKHTLGSRHRKLILISEPR